MWMSPQQAGVEEWVQNLALWLKLGVEACGALIIGAGVLLAAGRCLRQRLAGQRSDYNQLRLTFARFLALALELQLAADILSTAVAPSWDQIGKLGAIAVLRTALNYFLAREIREAEGSRAAA
ncbi:DUF1622 domain-containing protein [Chromobacterium paludis]|uniref:DUF1622 domain-containing protein n=1 Tax=Chromobacterium paludis TaxID=2605945 RepID=A0A5C1DL87_9NEIS|nr:DUF1622 domain-containing protein [Chromobacterium paludis]QEL57495.1 DUF1622 domain-containing protein [Chromobacterium paludis]